jgi:hypothetical protein
MSANKYGSVLFVITEDKKKRNGWNAIVNGFQLEGLYLSPPVFGPRKCEGLSNVVNYLKDQVFSILQVNPRAYALVLVDNDLSHWTEHHEEMAGEGISAIPGQMPNKHQKVRDVVPSELNDRVIIISAVDESEAVARHENCRKEEFGRRAAQACFNGESYFWEQNNQLKHNKSEIARLRYVWAMTL